MSNVHNQSSTSTSTSSTYREAEVVSVIECNARGEVIRHTMAAFMALCAVSKNDPHTGRPRRVLYITNDRTHTIHCPSFKELIGNKDTGFKYEENFSSEKLSVKRNANGKRVPLNCCTPAALRAYCSANLLAEGATPYVRLDRFDINSRASQDTLKFVLRHVGAEEVVEEAVEDVAEDVVAAPMLDTIESESATEVELPSHTGSDQDSSQSTLTEVPTTIELTNWQDEMDHDMLAYPQMRELVNTPSMRDYYTMIDQDEVAYTSVIAAPTDAQVKTEWMPMFD